MLQREVAPESLCHTTKHTGTGVNCTSGLLMNFSPLVGSISTFFRCCRTTSCEAAARLSATSCSLPARRAARRGRRHRVGILGLKETDQKFILQGVLFFYLLGMSLRRNELLQRGLTGFTASDGETLRKVLRCRIVSQLPHFQKPERSDGSVCHRRTGTSPSRPRPSTRNLHCTHTDIHTHTHARISQHRSAFI